MKAIEKITFSALGAVLVLVIFKFLMIAGVQIPQQISNVIVYLDSSN